MRSSAASKKNFLHFVKSQNLDLQSSSVKDMFTEFENTNMFLIVCQRSTSKMII